MLTEHGIGFSNIVIALGQYDELDRLKLNQYENERIHTGTHIQYCRLRETYDAVVKENTGLKAALKKEIGKNDLKARSIFGRKTEGLLSLIDAADHKTGEPVDESVMEEDDDASYERRSRIINLEEQKQKRQDSGTRTGTKKKRSLAASMKNLPPGACL